MDLICAGALAFYIPFYSLLNGVLGLMPLKGTVLVYCLILNGEISYFNNTKINPSMVVFEQFICGSSCYASCYWMSWNEDITVNVNQGPWSSGTVCVVITVLIHVALVNKQLSSETWSTVLNLGLLVFVMLSKTFTLRTSDPVNFHFRYLCPSVARMCIN